MSDLTRFPTLLAAALVLVTACGGPVRKAESLLAHNEPLGAFRVARAALKDPADLEEESRRRLHTALILSARQLLSQPDPQERALAFETYEGLPPESDERVRAAQRLLRVMVRTTEDPGELDTVLAAMEPEMGGEAEVRSNLRELATTARGTAAGLWAARTVVARWPEDADRWVELADAHAAQGQWDDANKALDQAAERLHAFCMELPARMATYDKVRRLSSYAQHELRRCDGFAALLARRWAMARQQREPLRVSTRQVNATSLPAVPCPPAGTPAPEAWAAGPSVVMVSPAPDAWWLDGRGMSAGPGAMADGEHVITFRVGGACRAQELVVRGETAVVVRSQHPDVEKVPAPR